MITMLATSSSFSYPKSRIAAAAVDVNGKLSPTYAQQYVLYNILMDVLKIVLPSSKLNHNGGISQTRASKKKEARSKRTSRAYLLAVLVIFCLVDRGEASWFKPPRRSLIDKANGEAVDTDLDHLKSPQLNWMQKILGSARMGGISGPLVSLYPPECRFMPCLLPLC